VAALLALIASLTWGVSDFAGGSVSRRVRPIVVVAVAHAVALAGLVLIAAVSGALGADPGYAAWGVAGGAVGLVGLVAFYQALSTGTMGIVAPIAGTGAAIPVVFGLLIGDQPSPWQYAGIVCAVAGVLLASGPELSGDAAAAGRRPVLLAVVSAVCFGLVFVFIERGSRIDLTMTLVAMRVTSLTLIACAAVWFARTRGWVALRGLRPGVRDVGVIAFVGITDALANGLYGAATRRGFVSVVSVLASLYPAVTVVLARLIHDERMRRVQAAGVGLALCGVVLLAIA
jgi:drug/metabolite transporter (DMT)-like permease